MHLYDGEDDDDCKLKERSTCFTQFSSTFMTEKLLLQTGRVGFECIALWEV